MPRPKRPGAPEPKKRSRKGCRQCKARKIKCDEKHPVCEVCQRNGEKCDYTIQLNWDGRGRAKVENATHISGRIDFSSSSISLGPGTAGLGNAKNSAASALAPPSVPEAAFTRQWPALEDEQRRFTDGAAYSPFPPPVLPLPPRDSNEDAIDPALMSPAGPDTFSNSGNAIERGQQEEIYIHNANKLQYIQSQKSESPSQFGAQSPSPGLSFLRNTQFNSPTPPFSGTSQDENGDIGQDQSGGRPPKRRRYPSSFENAYDSSMPPPLTPASVNEDDGFKSYTAKSSPYGRESPDIRRLSVNSLLSGPPGPNSNEHTHQPTSNPEIQDWAIQYQDVYQDTTTYGIDRGIKDLDIGRNDDLNAISGVSPVALREHLELVLDEGEQLSPIEFGFGTNNTAFDSGSYYDKPVSITIPRALEPLPNKLLENPMNLLYFHHFINHTAGCLIPHNCSSNPFRSILPRMAVQDDDLLNLLLAYSAAHRARLLRQPEPSMRIDLWVQDIFPNLRRALDDPSEIITNETLATAIMLASLEIISPKAFGPVAVPWQKHLDIARQIITRRGGPQRMQTVSRSDKVSSFLWSWFAYLDVLGSLSGGKAYSSSSAWMLDYEFDDENDYRIDCILGFTSRCVRILAKIAELARICDNERIGPDYEVDPKWKPSEETILRARKLETELEDSRRHPAKQCTHMQSSGEAEYHWDSLEMAATNEAFHWAGLAHLRRRVLGRPSKHPDVQEAIREIFGALYKVRRGSSAEACLLFPMFTAGCDTQHKGQRTDILDRMKGVEKLGMSQVHNARTLMERVWEKEKPWETLVAGEFFG